MSPELTNILQDLWKSSPLRDDDSASIVHWVSVLILEQERIKLGISENGNWIRDSGSFVIEITNNDSLVFLLPCLEKDYSEFRKQLASSLVKIGVFPSFSDKFPYFELILTGLRSNSAKWVFPALKWLEVYPLDNKTCAELDSLLLEFTKLRLPKKVWNQVRSWRAEHEN